MIDPRRCNRHLSVVGTFTCEPLEESRAGEPAAGGDLRNVAIGPPNIIVWVNMGAFGHNSCLTGSSGAPAPFTAAVTSERQALMF